MAKKRFQADQIIGKPREADVEVYKSQMTSQIVRKLRITEQTYYRWRNDYGGVRTDQAKRFKALGNRDLEKENAWLTNLVANHALDTAILR